MKTAYVLTLFFLAFLINDGYCCKLLINGCSTPTKNFYFKEVFTPACNRHDVCYACGQLYGWSRKECDKAFLNDMKTLCRRAGNKYSCPFASKVYHKAVQIAGPLFYKKPSLQWCSDSCVTSHGDPNIGI